MSRGEEEKWCLISHMIKTKRRAQLPLRALQQSRELEKFWEMKTEITGIPNGLEDLFDRKEDSFLLKSNKKWDLFSLLCF